MPRHARLKGEFSVYHIIQRGNEKKNLFLSDDDRFRFLETLLRMKKKYNFLLYAYCLMNNHVHLLIDDNGNDISGLIKSINVSYVHYFNRTHRRCGRLFQDRFKSELVDNDAYLLEVSGYIHNNPVKAQIVTEPSQFRWSSYNIYTGKEKDKNELINKEKILLSFSDSKSKAVQEYIKFVGSEGGNRAGVMDVEEPMEVNNKFIKTMEDARAELDQALANNGISYSELKNHNGLRNKFMKQIRRNSSLTLKQIGELCGGLSESRVSRILTKLDGQMGDRQARTVPTCPRGD